MNEISDRSLSFIAIGRLAQIVDLKEFVFMRRLVHSLEIMGVGSVRLLADEKPPLTNKSGGAHHKGRFPRNGLFTAFSLRCPEPDFYSGIGGANLKPVDLGF